MISPRSSPINVVPPMKLFHLPKSRVQTQRETLSRLTRPALTVILLHCTRDRFDSTLIRRV